MYKLISDESESESNSMVLHITINHVGNGRADGPFEVVLEMLKIGGAVSFKSLVRAL